MKRCILALYRSAVHAGSEWVGDLRHITAPGLVIWGAGDPYVTTDFGRRLAERTRATFPAIRGCGHWRQLERPDEVAAALRQHWEAVPGAPAR